MKASIIVPSSGHIDHFHLGKVWGPLEEETLDGVSQA